MLKLHFICKVFRSQRKHTIAHHGKFNDINKRKKTKILAIFSEIIILIHMLPVLYNVCPNLFTMIYFYSSVLFKVIFIDFLLLLSL